MGPDGSQDLPDVSSAVGVQGDGQVALRIPNPFDQAVLEEGVDGLLILFRPLLEAWYGGGTNLQAGALFSFLIREGLENILPGGHVSWIPSLWARRKTRIGIPYEKGRQEVARVVFVSPQPDASPGFARDLDPSNSGFGGVDLPAPVGQSGREALSLHLN